MIYLPQLGIYRVKDFEAYPNLVHAIFTRRGGFSQAPFQSLNLSSAVGDDPHTVARNLRQACRINHTTPKQIVSCDLAHGADVLKVDHTNRQPIMGRADGLITAEPGIYLFMCFADCAPILFYDPVRGAIGLTHAGWRGTMQNAAGATVQALEEQFGSRPEDIIAAIGPAIGACCYEVGPEVQNAAAGSLPNADRFFVGRNGSVHFDLPGANQRQLQEAGLRRIIDSSLCTACHTDRFFSHRAEKGQTGRFGVMIGLNQ